MVITIIPNIASKLLYNYSKFLGNAYLKHVSCPESARAATLLFAFLVVLVKYRPLLVYLSRELVIKKKKKNFFCSFPTTTQYNMEQKLQNLEVSDKPGQGKLSHSNNFFLESRFRSSQRRAQINWLYLPYITS